MEKLKLLIIDKEMNLTEIEINRLQFQSLGIDLSKVTFHTSKRELNKTITKFIEENQ